MDRNALDRYITGNYGNDQDREPVDAPDRYDRDPRPEPEYCEGCWTNPCTCPTVEDERAARQRAIVQVDGEVTITGYGIGGLIITHKPKGGAK
jgi:hypothetical protein